MTTQTSHTSSDDALEPSSINGNQKTIPSLSHLKKIEELEISISHALLAAKKDPLWPTLTKNKTGRFKYADLSHILELFSPVLYRHNLLLIFKPIVDRTTNAEIMRTVLIHTPSKEEIIAESLIKSGDTDTKWGGSQTYQKRYGILAVLGISADDVDPDELIDLEDIEKLKSAIRANPYAKDVTTHNKIWRSLLAYGKLEKMEQMRYECLNDALRFINEWKD